MYSIDELTKNEKEEAPKPTLEDLYKAVEDLTTKVTDLYSKIAEMPVSGDSSEDYEPTTNEE